MRIIWVTGAPKFTAWPFCMMTWFFKPVVSGRESTLPRSSPVMAPAQVTVMPAAAQWVTVPASAPVASAMASLATFRNSGMSMNSDMASITRLVTSGGTAAAPRCVILPQALMMGVKP